MTQLYYKKVSQTLHCVCVCVCGPGFLNILCFQAIYSPYRDRIPLQIVRAEVELSAEERAYLTAVEKGNTSAPSRFSGVFLMTRRAALTPVS